jgi:cytochrome c oxidase subunit 1
MMLGRKAALLVLVAMAALIAAPTMTSLPSGIDSQGDSGCTCHGDSSTATTIVVEGLPENFTAGQSYDFTLTVVNDGMTLWQDGDAEAGWNGRSGGFRVIVSEGTVTGESTLTQELKGGLTHTTAGNKMRSWNLTWSAPGDDSKVVEFTLLGNAVNGGDGYNGDQWSSISTSIPGINADAVTASAPPLRILMTAVLLSVALMTLSVMYIFYSRNPEGFSLATFWDYLKGWLTTTDHKGIGLLYFAYGFFFFLVGGLLAMLFRIQLMFPENDFLEYAEYNSFFTLHGTTMIFLAAMPMIAGFGNYIVPLQIGAQDLAFPRINALGFWFIAFSCILIFTGVFTGEAADITWVMYPPYSSLTGDSIYANSPGTVSFIAGIVMLGASSTLSGINFIATIFVMRAPGVTWMKMPLFTWSFLISMFMLYLSLPALIVGVLFLYLDHTIGTAFFAINAGDPILFQHLFWFFGHPEVYVVIVPAFGIVSEVLATSARRSIFGYKSMVYAMAGIGLLGFVVWGHHMLTSGMDPTLRVVMMATTMLVAIPTGIKIFNWLATLWGGALVFKTHTLWALGFVVTFTLGGISGMFFPVVGLDMHFHDTYFVVAHFHYVLIGGTVFGLFAGLYYWYPKAFGRKLSERLGVIHFLISFIAYNAAFWPMHVVGTMGMPRRTHTYTVESGYAALNYSISVASFIFGLAQLILVWNLIYSSKKGEKIGEDPWGGWSLEWTTASPPPTPSFAEIPTQGDDNEHEEKGSLTRMASRLWSLGMKKEVRH